MLMGFLQRVSLRENTRNNSIRHYDWDKTAKTFENILDNIELTDLQGKWDSGPMMPITDVKVPPLGTNRRIVHFVMEHVIKNPHMIKTATIQQIIRNLDLGYQQDGQRVTQFSFEQAMSILEDNMNNKSLWESVRTGAIPIPDTLRYIIDYK